MSPIVSHNNTATELNKLVGISDVTLIPTSIGVHIIQNHQLVAVVQMPIMKIVRAIRKKYDTMQINVVI